jgi:hypothetical protein
MMLYKDIEINNFYKYIKVLSIAAVYTLLIVSLPGAALSENKPDQIKISETLHRGLNHLLSLVGQENHDKNSFDVKEITSLLDFVASDKPEKTLYYVDNSFGATSAYHEFVIEKDLQHILRFSFNPDIPSYVTTPSSVRLSRWTGIGREGFEFPSLLNSLYNLEETVMVKGIETIENTPDLFTGGYYKYDLDRTILLFEHEGKKILISLSKQKDVSGVGKKGAVLGSDGDWSYLYSGEKGLNKSGLGWVSSYMYDSYSVIVYMEEKSSPPLVKCGTFKWLRAGWSNINMVKKEHIYRGLNRFAETYKSIIENLSQPDADKIARAYARITGLDDATLRNANQSYLQSLKERYAQDKSLSVKWIDRLFEDDAFVSNMSRSELQAVLVLEYLKRSLGKPYDLDVESL